MNGISEWVNLCECKLKTFNNTRSYIQAELHLHTRIHMIYKNFS